MCGHMASKMQELANAKQFKLGIESSGGIYSITGGWDQGQQSERRRDIYFSWVQRAHRSIIIIDILAEVL